MTRAKDISKILTDADLSGTLDVTGDLTVDTNTLKVDSSNNRVGIGTSPSTKLEINGGTDNNIVRIVSTDANANIEFADNTTTSGLQIGANGDNMKFGISGAEVMRIDSSGNVGIGTASPSELIHANGSAVSALKLTTNSYTNGTVFKVQGDGSSYIYNTENAMLRLGTNNLERMRIDASGNVGIGDYAPDMTTVIAYSDSGTDFNANDFTGGLGIYNTNDSNNTSSAINFKGGSRHDVVRIGAVRTSNSTSTSSNSADFVVSTRHLSSSLGERFRITSNGSVGIGTSSPSSPLHITGNATTTDLATRGVHLHDTSTANEDILPITFTFTSTANRARAGIGGISRSADAVAGYGGAIGFYTRAAADASTLSSSDERMRIDESGNLNIGRTSTLNDSFVAIEFNGTTKNGIVLKTTRTEPTGTNYLYFVNSSGTNTGEIQQTGTTTVNYSTSSDYRLKENVTADWDATTRLKQLNPVRFNFIADGADKVVDGFLAHEVQSVVPEAITGEKDAVDADGNPKYQGIDQSKLVPLLVKTIQELEARITALETA